MKRRWRPLAASALAAALIAPAASAAQQQPEEDPASGIVASLMLFAGNRAGLWQSSNWGGSWERLRGAPSGDAVDATGAVYDILATTSGVYVVAEAGLYVSGDFGHSWKHHPLETPALAVVPSRYPGSDPTILVGTDGGLLRSRDAGKSFEPTALMGTRVYRVLWPGPQLVVATDAGVRVSVDAGDVFETPGVGLPAGPVRALVVSSLFALDPVMLAGVAGEGVFRSSDGGARWQRVGLAGVTVNDLFWFGPFLYAATDDGLFRSQDAGARFQRLGPRLAGVRLYELLFPRYPESGVEVFVSSERGLFRSLDGGETWQLSGFEGQEILAVATFPPPLQLPDKKKKK